jgi:hypothetical protein
VDKDDAQPEGHDLEEPWEKIFDAHFAKEIVSHERSLAPQLEAQTKMGTQVITLSSATLTVSVGALFTLIGRVQHLRGAAFLISGLILLLLVILLGTIRESWIAAARSFPLSVNLLKGRIAELAHEVAHRHLTSQQLDVRMDAIAEELGEDQLRALRKLLASQRAMLVLFTIALAALAVFGMINLPIF